MFGWSRRARAARRADALDAVVDAQLAFVRRMPDELRSRPADALAVLVMVAQDHRHYAQGWISGHELRARTKRSFSTLEESRVRPAGVTL